MTYRGHIRQGVAVLDEPVNLPDGTPVRVAVDRSDAEFWEGKGVELLAREQGIEPCTDPRDLVGDWPSDESLDQFVALIRGSRVG